MLVILFFLIIYFFMLLILFFVITEIIILRFILLLFYIKIYEKKLLFTFHLCFQIAAVSITQSYSHTHNTPGMRPAGSAIILLVTPVGPSE